nr:Integrase domain containing protein [Haemonchus contortus]
MRHGATSPDSPVGNLAHCTYESNNYPETDDIVEFPKSKTVPVRSIVRRERLVVPKKLKEPVFLALHSGPSAGGHFDWRKMLAKISRKYFWPHKAEDIFALVRSCEQCQSKRNQRTNRELLAPVRSGAIFDKVYVDLTGPLHTSENGNKYILAMIDHFSKYVIATPLRDCTAITVAPAIMSDCILVYGVMTQLVSDDASYFKGEVLPEVGHLLRISRYFTTPYRHEGNGACERVFATFHPMLRTYIAENQLDWDRYVKSCAFMYNTSVHTSTNNTPYFLMFGRDPVFNIDLLIKDDLERHTSSLDDTGLYVENLVATLHAAWRSAKDFSDRQRAKYKQQHDRTHLRPLDIRVGDRVFLRDLAPKVGLSSKLCNSWLGQFRVVEVDPANLTIVSVSAPQSSPRRVHMNQVKCCYELSGPVFTSQWTPIDEQVALSAAGATELTMPGYSHQHLEDSIDIRFITADTIRSVQQGIYRDIDVDNVPLNTDDPRQSLIDPTTRNQRRPVLYQVVSTGWGTGVILEAKDFFLVGPNRRDLHCIVLDQYAINHLTGLRGFDKDKVSVKDFVWVYNLKPTRQALRKPEETFTASKYQRTTALNMNSAYFFRAESFAFVTPVTLPEPVYGIILSRKHIREGTSPPLEPCSKERPTP